MDLFEALILGIVQGATEYIPVSSSAHLILVPWFLGWSDASFAFEVLVQWGTLVGVFIFFWQDIVGITRAVIQGLLELKPLATPASKLGWLVVVATIPAVVIGLAFQDLFQATFDEPVLAGGLLMLTAVLLVAAEWLGPRLSAGGRNLDSLGWWDAVLIGFWQAAAILPGISRSGATIGGAVIQGFNRAAAARFSFLMSIPALLGAGVVAVIDLVETGLVMEEMAALTVGFIASAISGYVCIRWLLHYLQRNSLYVFAAYCAVISLITIGVNFYRG